MGRVLRSAESDLDVYEISLFISRDNARAADRMIDKFDYALSLISDFPGMGEARDALKNGMRSYPVGSYLLFYVPVEGGVELVRVVHGMRDLNALFPRA